MRRHLLRSLASQMAPDVFERYIREFGGDSSDRAALDLCKRRTGQVAGELQAWWCGNGCAFHGQRE
jgi:hypothetical protein